MMIKWFILKLLGTNKKEIQKTLAQSSTTRTVAVASISTIAIVRAVLAALAELGLISPDFIDETAMVIVAVGIPFVSRLLAILKSKIGN